MKRFSQVLPPKAYCACLLLVLTWLPTAPVKALDGAAWSRLTREGSKAYESGNFGEAERLFKQALEELKGCQASDIRLAESYNNLAVLYVNRNQLPKAEPLFEKTLKIKEASLGAHDKDVIALTAKLALFYLGNGKKDKAQPLIDKMTMYGEREARQLYEISNAFKKLSNYYSSHHKLENAEISVKQAEGETLGQARAQAQETAVLLDSVGDAIKGSAEGLKQAERLFKSSLSLREKTLPPEHAALSASLENLGKVYQSQGRLALAEPLLRRSYEISLNTLGMERRETQKRLESLGQLLTQENRLAEARSLYQKVLNPESGDKPGSKTSFKPSADFLSGFAALLVKEGRYGEALPYYARALKLQEALNGPQHASLAALLESYAYALNKANRQAEANKLSLRARSIRG